MISKFKKSGLLPEGIHVASWKEFEERFATNLHRQKLLEGLKNGLKILHSYGCDEIYIDGSFVTDKPDPGDIDVCYNNMYMDLEGLKKECPEFFDSAKGITGKKRNSVASSTHTTASILSLSISFRSAGMARQRVW